MDFDRWAKKTQYIIIESPSYSNNAFAIDFGYKSNIFIQEMRDVIGIKLVDFYVTNVGLNGDAGLRADGIQYIDIVCPDIPFASQLLSEKGQIWARIGMERSFSGSTDFNVHDKQWKGYTQKLNYFNPISVKQLNFKVYEAQEDLDYLPLNPNCTFYMIIEVTTLDHLMPPVDSNMRVVNAIETFCNKVDVLVAKLPKEPVKAKKFSSAWILVAALVVGFLIYWFRRPGPAPPVV
jgi:hypothetical protein